MTGNIGIDHVVYLDSKAKELENILFGSKTMIVRGAMGRKIPYDRVEPRDRLYFINNDAQGKILARGIVKNIINSPKMSFEESGEFLERFQSKLQLTQNQIKRWTGKRYLVLIEIGDVEKIEPFSIDKSDYGNMDDWLLVKDIENVKIK